MSERGGYRGDLPDVYVDEPLADDATHEGMVSRSRATNDRDEPREEQGRAEHQKHGAAERSAHRVRAKTDHVLHVLVLVDAATARWPRFFARAKLLI